MIPPWIDIKPNVLVAKHSLRVSRIMGISGLGSYSTLPHRKMDSESREPVPIVNEAIGQNIDTFA